MGGITLLLGKSAQREGGKTKKEKKTGTVL